MDIDNFEIIRILRPNVVYSDTKIPFLHGEHYHIFDVFTRNKRESYLIYAYGDGENTRFSFQSDSDDWKIVKGEEEKSKKNRCHTT